MIEKELADVLFKRNRKISVRADSHLAAVLILLYKADEDYKIVLIVRSRDAAHHKGEVSFPGGAYKKEDNSLEATALRESSEEIGINSGDVMILGALDDTTTTTSNYRITPFVAVIPYEPKFRKNRLEVEEILEVPLSELDRSRFKQETGICAYEYKNHTVWGATGRILKNFLDLLDNLK